MNTQRYNIYNFIHKALRALLYDTALCIQQTDFANKEEAEVALGKIDAVLSIFRSHAHHEDNHVMPAVRKYDLFIANENESEHERDEALTLGMESKMEVIRTAASGEIAKKAGIEIMYLFVEFTAFNLVHMNKEENVINEVLWKNYTDQDLHEMTNKIIASTSPADMQFTTEWMIRGINDPELEIFLGNLKAAMPPHVFDQILLLAEKVLPSKRWLKLSESLKSVLV